MANTNWTEDQIADATKMAILMAKIPAAKKPILEASMNAYIEGYMAGVEAGKEKESA